jgi:serine/threonine-protein kinase
MYSGQLGPARKAVERALKISPDHSQLRGDLAILDLLEGNPQSAMHRFDGLPSASLGRLAGVAMAQHDLGHPSESQQALNLLTAKYSRTSPFSIAMVYAWRGEKDHAFEWLERAYAQPDPVLGIMKTTPFLRKLHDDPRWAELLKKMNLPAD